MPSRDELVQRIREAIAIKHPDTEVEQAAADAIFVEFQIVDGERHQIQERLTLELERSGIAQEVIEDARGRTTTPKALKDKIQKLDDWDNQWKVK